MIVIAPLHELDEAIAHWRPSHIVSLASPGAAKAELPIDAEVLRLEFHDIPEPAKGLVAVSPADVDRLLAFGCAWPAERALLIHCWAGVSRSPAAAFVLSCGRSSLGSEMRLAGLLRAAAPFATPNPRIVSLADSALGRRGAMTSAIAGIGRGKETSTGTTFVLP